MTVAELKEMLERLEERLGDIDDFDIKVDVCGDEFGCSSEDYDVGTLHVCYGTTNVCYIACK